MKAYCVLALFALSVSAASVANDDTTRINGENGWYVPQTDGSFIWMDKNEAESKLNGLEKDVEIKDFLSISPVTFTLFTKSNPTTGIVITQSAKSIKASGFNKANPTRFTIHGWGGSASDAMNSQIRDAWFSRGDYNIIVVDWARARSIEYASSVVAVPGVGKKIASMIDYLFSKHGMSLQNLDVIGHSLGAHVAGFTGKNVQSGQVHSIVGLDPALPLYSYDMPDKRLNSDDAFYVESIQTNGGKLGFLKPIGKGAFYPNGGKSQPGCGVDLTGSCAHGRSVTYYIEAVQSNDFPSMKCSDYEKAVAKNCGNTYSSVRMGAISNAYMVAGNFYVPVHNDAPFGYGA